MYITIFLIFSQYLLLATVASAILLTDENLGN